MSVTMQFSSSTPPTSKPDFGGIAFCPWFSTSIIGCGPRECWLLQSLEGLSRWVVVDEDEPQQTTWAIVGASATRVEQDTLGVGDEQPSMQQSVRAEEGAWGSVGPSHPSIERASGASRICVVVL